MDENDIEIDPKKIEVIQNVKAHILKRLRPFEM
jgi:hypothetical protein